MKRFLTSAISILVLIGCESNGSSKQPTNPLFGKWQAMVSSPDERMRGVTTTRVLEFKTDTTGEMTLRFINPKFGDDLEVSAPFKYKQILSGFEFTYGTAKCKINQTPKTEELAAKAFCDEIVTALTNHKEQELQASGENLPTINDGVLTTACFKGHFLGNGLPLTYKKMQ